MQDHQDASNSAQPQAVFDEHWMYNLPFEFEYPPAGSQPPSQFDPPPDPPPQPIDYGDYGNAPQTFDQVENFQDTLAQPFDPYPSAEAVPDQAFNPAWYSNQYPAHTPGPTQYPSALQTFNAAPHSNYAPIQTSNSAGPSNASAPQTLAPVQYSNAPLRQSFDPALYASTSLGQTFDPVQFLYAPVGQTYNTSQQPNHDPVGQISAATCYADNTLGQGFDPAQYTNAPVGQMGHAQYLDAAYIGPTYNTAQYPGIPFDPASNGPLGQSSVSWKAPQAPQPSEDVPAQFDTQRMTQDIEASRQLERQLRSKTTSKDAHPKRKGPRTRLSSKLEHEHEQPEASSSGSRLAGSAPPPQLIAFDDIRAPGDINAFEEEVLPAAPPSTETPAPKRARRALTGRNLTVNEQVLRACVTRSGLQISLDDPPPPPPPEALDENGILHGRGRRRASGKKPRFGCRFTGCPSSSLTKGQFDKHMLTHFDAEQKPFKCPGGCNKSYSRNDALKRHLKHSRKVNTKCYKLVALVIGPEEKDWGVQMCEVVKFNLRMNPNLGVVIR
ncbi:hypothetical protein PUNSTDRAFT_134638 [Punctularia strigosozonata HHB-11173 SS5]|uniref:uncharacterized protein n=1 Tax=Punctularia strigosozonata (strain HHB-11173) TaxID=741275 RepID=UPI000441682C|nr:uncharacterized protein PUNSTDRAFT_134638 [Punctularia strigosozonata HHB-11173 SS5]EIN08246.1 hypothetical protein PUNSTDRAFT_134638 [Punctularia strigosozonata HHB-11173 SS5]